VSTPLPVAASGTFTFAASSGDPMTVHRLGFGGMRLTGPGIWNDPADRDAAIKVLQRAVQLGVDFIDTADSYGPETNEMLIRDALFPYDGLLIATKGGLTRQGPDQWTPVGRPEYLRQCVQLSLRRLGIERIDLWQLHRIDPLVPADEQFGAIREMQREGLIRHVGLSEVSIEELELARQALDIVSVQNLYNVGQRRSEPLLDHCAANGIGFIPWFPLAERQILGADGPLAQTAARLGCTTSQVALSWLLQRSPVMLPIPGTSSVAHLEENCRYVELDAQAVTALDAVAST
jgi:pyridoxine 4-dehydrogenase